MTDISDYVNVPDNLEEINITREIKHMMSTEKYRTEEQDHLEINDRLFVVRPGAVLGTIELFANHNLPDDQLGDAQWAIVFMGRVDKQLYPLRFHGDAQQCARDIALLRLSVS